MRDAVRFDHEICIARGEAAASCIKCADACPTNAISVKATSVLIADDDCIVCGRCTAACPTGALSVVGFDPISRAGPENEPLYFECRRVPADMAVGTTAIVPCLGGLDANALFEALVASPGRRVVLVDRGWCESCAAGCGDGLPAKAAIAEARTTLDALDLAESVAVETHKLPLSLRRAGPQQIDVSRRGFLRRFMVNDAQSRMPAAPASAADPAAKRLRRLDLLARLSALTGRKVPAHEFPEISVSAACTHHELCAALCPTGALRSYRTDDTAGLEFDTTRCLGCKRCEAICPNRAISLGAARDDAPVTVAVTRHRLTTCVTCETPFVDRSGAGECPSCRKATGLFADLLSHKRRHDYRQESGNGDHSHGSH